MKDSAAETTRVEEGESHTLGRGEEHTHTHPNLQIFYGEAGMRAFVCLFCFVWRLCVQQKLVLLRFKLLYQKLLSCK